MCDECDFEKALDDIGDALGAIDDLPERAEEFAASVAEKLEDIGRWIEKYEHVTEKQRVAIENMSCGIGKWIH